MLSVGDKLDERFLDLSLFTFTFHPSLFTFHIPPSAPPPFLLEPTAQKKLLRRGLGDQLSTLSTATVYKPLVVLLMAQMALSFCVGTSDYVDRCRQTTYDTGYSALLFDT